jgi:hypothetical protein
LVDSPVPVGERDHVHQQVEWGQEPGEEAVTRKITVERGERSPPVPAEIEKAQGDINREDDRNEIDRQGEGDDSLGRSFEEPEEPGAANTNPWQNGFGDHPLSLEDGVESVLSGGRGLHGLAEPFRSPSQPLNLIHLFLSA